MLKQILNIILCTILLSCGGKETSKKKSDQILDADKEIKELLQKHDFKVEEKNDWLVPDFKEEVLIKSHITLNEQETWVSSRMDVEIEFDDGRTLVESFGDVGSNVNEAIANNINNFVVNDFHVISNALNGTSDEQITIENWEIGGESYIAYIGNLGLKGSEEFSIPEEAFNKIEEQIKGFVLGKDYHWIRFYYAQMNHEAMDVEFMLDNELNNKANEVLKKITWDSKEGFYSIRNFIMLKKAYNKG